MKKMFRDLMVSFVVSFGYVLFSNLAESAIVGFIISLSAAGMFSLCSASVRYIAEEFAEMNNATEEQVERRMQIGAVVRDSIIAFAVVYGFMTRDLGLALTIGQTAGYLVAALAPTAVIAILSKEARIPFLVEYRKHDAVAREMGFQKVA